MSMDVPSWLEVPSQSLVRPPVETLAQSLPFEELAWEDFEKLCLRLARLEADVESCRVYGVRGQNQEGIDLYAKSRTARDKYSVYQCKRVETFGTSQIRAAVDLFVEGSWAPRSDRFVLCTSQSLAPVLRTEEAEFQAHRLEEQGIRLEVWDADDLSLKLKSLPDLVKDFFGNAWLTSFLGPEASALLEHRLDPRRVIEYRQRLSSLYKNVFHSHDPGLPGISGMRALRLQERFVLPDITETTTSRESTGELLGEMLEDARLPLLSHEGPSATPAMAFIPYRSLPPRIHRRIPVDHWLGAGEYSRSAVLGAPGSGKSTLLRYIALDLLEGEPKLGALARRWGAFLPVWVPFGYWTARIAESPAEDWSIANTLRQWLTNWQEERLWPLLQSALEDDRLLLLVDGLDEWKTEDAARLALTQLEVFGSQRGTPIIASSRPHGFHRLAMDVSGWQVGEIASLSRDQKHNLAALWFENWTRGLNPDGSHEQSSGGQQADLLTSSFMAELDRSTSVDELGKVPLLLCLLITFRLHSVHLPESRFRAYEGLVSHLVSTHPQRRRTAAFVASTGDRLLRDEEVVAALSALAFRLQTDFPGGVIPIADALASVDEFVRAAEYGLCLEGAVARRASREVLDLAENSAGLLVKKSEGDIGFFHRALQEFLAASHIAQSALQEQLSLVAERCQNPQWHEVILCLLYLTRRAEDVASFLDRILSAASEHKPVERYGVELLLAEAAIGTPTCPVPLARRLVERACGHVESEAWMPYREGKLPYRVDS
jgi:hypothetical protein